MTKKAFVHFAIVYFVLVTGPGETYAQTGKPIGDVELDSGITLKDWLQLPKVTNPTNPLAIGTEAARYVRRYGPYRELLEIVRQASQADALSPSAITHENAAAKVAELQSARAALGDWPALLMSSAIAQGMTGNGSAALADLKTWLRTVPATDPERADVVSVLADADRNPQVINEYLARRESKNEDVARAIDPSVLPFKVDPAVWAAIQASDRFRSGRKAKTITIRSIRRHISSYKSLTSEDIVTEAIMLTPVGERCVKRHIEAVSKPISSNASKIKPEVYDEYSCANLPVIQPSNDALSEKILTIEGSLFPPRIGARTVDEYETTTGGGRVTQFKKSCTIIAKAGTSKLSDGLTDETWRLSCTSVVANRNEMASAIPYTYQDLLFERLGVRLSQMLSFPISGDPVVPYPGYVARYTDKGNGGDGDYTATNTFESFTLTVNQP